jgi:hypothetical protein
VAGPPRNDAIEKTLADKGITYELTNIDISLFDVARSQANQARIQSPLNNSTVETYVAAMSRGDEFPPVLAYKMARTERYVIIDGNHRLASALSAGLKTLWAYVVAPGTSAEMITVLTYEANTKHGLPTSEAERARHAVYLIENAGETIKAAAARMNLSTTFLTRHYNKIRADQRAGLLGIPDARWYELSVSARHRLNTIKADETFEAAAKFAIKARLNADEVDTLVTKINKEGSVSTQLTLVQRIQDVVTGKLRPKQQQHTGPRRALFNAYGMIESASIEEKQEQFTSSFNPIEAEEWAAKLRDAAAKMQRMADLLAVRATE